MAEEKETRKKEKAPVEAKVEDKVSSDENQEPKQLEDFRTLGEPSKAAKPEAKAESTPAVKKESKKKGKSEEVKADLERIYVVPLRRGFLKVPEYKRSKKAVKTLKEFLAKHMKVPGRDLTKVKIDKYLNNEIWFRGIRKPLHKVKVRARKIGDIVYAELAEMPDAVVYKRGRDEKKKLKVDKKKLDKVVAQEAAEAKKKSERSDKADRADEKEKEAAVAEAGAEMNKEMAKTEKHTAKAKSAKMDMMSETSKRKAMKR